MREYRPLAFQHPLVAPQQIYPLSTPPGKNGNENSNGNGSGNGNNGGKALMAGADVIDFTGDDHDVRTVSNQRCSGYSSECFGSVRWIVGKNVCYGSFSSCASSIRRPVYHPLAENTSLV